MTKTELIKAIAEKSEITIKTISTVLNSFIDIVCENLNKGIDISIIGFGSILVTKRKARLARNLQTGKMMNIPTSKTVKFKAGKTLKNSVARS